ncbi:MAG TPA: hypothetical protein VIN59_00720 [Alphaproteobacteria bacterium]
MIKRNSDYLTRLLDGKAHQFEHEQCGWVEVRYFLENEFKLAVCATADNKDHEQNAANALWAAYVKHQIPTWRKAFGKALSRVGGDEINDEPAFENKPQRMRDFDTVWHPHKKKETYHGHPVGIEIRREGLTTLIKISLMDESTGSPFLKRLEVHIRQQFPGQFGFSKIRNPIGERLASEFQSKARRFTGARTFSQRAKQTLPIIFEWNGVELITRVEGARDLAVAHSIAGHQRNITEFEGEVKNIYLAEAYRNGNGVDLKKSPQVAGWTHAQIDEISNAILMQERQALLDFALNFFDMKGFKDCALQPVLHSKSHPEIMALHNVFQHGSEKVIPDAVREVRKNDAYAINQALNQERLRIDAARLSVAA